MWMEGRVHGEYTALETPLGYIPKYDDVETLFDVLLGKKYSREEYDRQFSIRADSYIAKMDRIEAAYIIEKSIPDKFYIILKEVKDRLISAKLHFGMGVIKPEYFE